MNAGLVDEIRLVVQPIVLRGEPCQGRERTACAASSGPLKRSELSVPTEPAPFSGRFLTPTRGRPYGVLP